MLLAALEVTYYVLPPSHPLGILGFALCTNSPLTLIFAAELLDCLRLVADENALD
jgi:hypothetical protein